MANTNAPFGLRPVRHIDGTPWNGATVRCYIGSDYGTALYIGDPVLLTTDLSAKDAGANYLSVQLSAGTTGVIIRGVITSFEPRPQDLTQQYKPASQARWMNVCMATPDLIFQVQDDGDGTPAAVWPGQNAVLAAGTSSTVTGMSGYVLDGSTTPTTTQAHTLHIIGLADIANNELGDYGIWDVIINTSRNATGTFLGITAT